MDNLPRKILIAGVGRSGTTFLISLLTFLGFDTGLQKEYVLSTIHNTKAHAGLEDLNLHDHHVLKDPQFCYQIRELSKIWKIDWVIIPVRNMDEAAASRVANENGAGGLWHASDFESQRLILWRFFGQLVSDVIVEQIPYFFILFPRLATDADYCFRILSPILSELPDLDFVTFKEIYDSLSKPEYIHTFNPE